MREISLHILDLIENALEAGATRIDLGIAEDTAANRLSISVTDNGRGIDEETIPKVGDPFYTTRTTRHVGLGIPLLKAAAERCNGSLTINSRLGQGTIVVAEFKWDHIDRAPLGDMASTLLGVVVSQPSVSLRLSHQVDGHTFAFDTAEMREALGEVPFSHPRVREWLMGFLNEGYSELYARRQLLQHSHIPRREDAKDQVAG